MHAGSVSVIIQEVNIAYGMFYSRSSQYFEKYSIFFNITSETAIHFKFNFYSRPTLLCITNYQQNTRWLVSVNQISTTMCCDVLHVSLPWNFWHRASWWTISDAKWLWR